MLVFIVLVAVLSVLSQIQILDGDGNVSIKRLDTATTQVKACDDARRAVNPKQRAQSSTAYTFKTADDCADYMELRRTKWKGNADSYYSSIEDDIPM